MNTDILVEIAEDERSNDSALVTIKVKGELIYSSPESAFFWCDGGVAGREEEYDNIKTLLNARTDSIDIWQELVRRIEWDL